MGAANASARTVQRAQSGAIPSDSVRMARGRPRPRRGGPCRPGRAGRRAFGQAVHFAFRSDCTGQRRFIVDRLGNVTACGKNESRCRERRKLRSSARRNLLILHRLQNESKTNFLLSVMSPLRPTASSGVGRHAARRLAHRRGGLLGQQGCHLLSRKLFARRIRTHFAVGVVRRRWQLAIAPQFMAKRQRGRGVGS